MDLGELVKVHEDIPAEETQVVSVPVRPSERHARLRRLERRALEVAPVRSTPVETPKRKPERMK